MIAQELCLENEPGAGAAYMEAFDELPTIVQHRLRESPLNICVACLQNVARALAETHDPSPQYYCEAISHFEKGTIHDLRERIQSPRFQELHEGMISRKTAESNRIGDLIEGELRTTYNPEMKRIAK